MPEERLISMMNYLIRKENVTAEELSMHFSVSQRTIYRDIEALSRLGFPIYTEKGRNGGIRLLDGYRVDSFLLTRKEKDVLLDSLKALSLSGRKELEDIIGKFESLGTAEKESERIEIDWTNWRGRSEEYEKFENIRSALEKRRLIEFDYHNSPGGDSHRTAEPITLLFKAYSWYLKAYCRTSDAFKVFKLSRITDLKIRAENYQRKVYPEEKKLERSMGEMMEVALRFSEKVAYRVYDEFPSSSIEKKSGYLLVRTQLEDGNYLVPYLLSFENELIVLSPVSLKERVLKEVEKIVGNYTLEQHQ